MIYVVSFCWPGGDEFVERIEATPSQATRLAEILRGMETLELIECPAVEAEQNVPTTLADFMVKTEFVKEWWTEEEIASVLQA